MLGTNEMDGAADKLGAADSIVEEANAARGACMLTRAGGDLFFCWPVPSSSV